MLRPVFNFFELIEGSDALGRRSFDAEMFDSEGMVRA
jgi:hypothetical protein